MLRYAMERHRTGLQWSSSDMPWNCTETEILLQEEKL
nr:MAG TPA: hypothetical protein [Caudoviricetes sp.]